MATRFYKVVVGIARPIIRFLYRMKVTGTENFDYEGKMIISSNHISAMDPILIACATKKELNFMAKKELFKFKPLAFFLKKLGAFPVDRGAGDMAAISTAGKILREGNSLVIFPEGTRNRESEELMKFQDGTALLAVRFKSDILPVAIQNRPRLFRRTKIAIGSPIKVMEIIDSEANTRKNLSTVSEKLYLVESTLKEQ
ncbi:MAG: 1-acyl-sn-glycerol-3-phosphate acyltransferase [Clostridia bacterium]|jgi:1-acyl-sn-glycerol-3-phosphate acyltransferase|nr:1-acyl-sn-glycerol-3-phosphate acyltransferase [Clostridia bacterium]MBR0437952.1 1-acyl-sn-glycerol-3-phosphate acyltransferase [Clostridia bacterium]MBR3563179.1 1-acyl-sn-glycerol-3-phosphate acyltransferase [Clostridia bacterium]MBR4623458.1 1-acyl-sn-glycerol-3-phosphate acyltransferase [Clostridia bacterium]MBR6822398.1 1-acyl-sn-glycerol-3-phosphate acyltransferase [Clostridia bacterium]